MELDINFDAPIPKSKRSGSGREGEPWEQHLSPLKGAVDEKGEPRGARIFTFEDKVNKNGNVTNAKAQAATKVALISARLRKVSPKEEWKFNIRPLTEDEKTFGLWVTYVRTMNDDEYKAYLVRRDERSKKIQATRAKTAASTATLTVASESPADKVKAAREKAATV